MHAALESLGLRHTDSRANFVFFQTAAADRIRAAATAASIEVARAFPPLNDWVRVTLGLPQENLRFLDVLRTNFR